MDVALHAALVGACRSLHLLSGGYRQISDATYAWAATRPGPGWHAHGFTGCRRRIAFGEGQIREVTVLKQRWLNTEAVEGEPRTRHDRPPDDLGGPYDALIVAGSLWCWLDAALGLHSYLEPYDGGPAPRTLQRWLHKAFPNALSTQHAIREVLIERCEPRPVEQLFPGGVPPPGCRRRRGWRDPDRTSTLCQGLTMLFRGAHGVDLAPSALLAGARRRGSHPRATVLY